MQASTYFPKVGEKNAALFFSFHLRTPLASFHAASRAPRSCHSVSSWDRCSNLGALGLRWWGSPGQINPSEGFWVRMLAWRKRLSWIPHVELVSVRLSPSVESMETSAAPYPERRNPIVVYSMNCTQQVRGLARDVSRQTTGFPVLPSFEKWLQFWRVTGLLFWN